MQRLPIPCLGPGNDAYEHEIRTQHYEGYERPQSAVQKKPRRTWENGEGNPHAITPGLQVRPSITALTPQRNRHFDDLGTTTQCIDQQL